MCTLKCQIDLLLLLIYYQKLSHTHNLLYFYILQNKRKINLIDSYIMYGCLSAQHKNKPFLPMHLSFLLKRSMYTIFSLSIKPFFQCMFLYTQLYIN